MSHGLVVQFFGIYPYRSTITRPGTKYEKDSFFHLIFICFVPRTGTRLFTMSMLVMMHEWQNRTTIVGCIELLIVSGEVARAWYLGNYDRPTPFRLISGSSYYWLFWVDRETTCNQQNRKVRNRNAFYCQFALVLSFSSKNTTFNQVSALTKASFHHVCFKILNVGEDMSEAESLKSLMYQLWDPFMKSVHREHR